MKQAKCRAVLFALITVLAAGSHAGQAAGEEVVFDESFSVKPGGELEITVGDMDILLEPGKSNEARVKVTVSGNVDKMRKRFEKMDFTAELVGNTLVIDTDERRWSTSWWGFGGGGDINLAVTIPAQFDIEAKTSDGDIAAGGFEGDIELKSSDGDISVDRLSGLRVHLITSDGDIVVDDVESDDILLRTSDGDLTADLLRGASVTLKTSDGNIDADEIEAESISARSSDGDLDLTVSGEELTAKTSDGDIDVTVAGEMAIDLTTSDGDVTLRAPKDIGAVLDLRGEKVKLGGKVSLDGEVSTRYISGKLGEGGPKVRVRTSDGSVVIRFD